MPALRAVEDNHDSVDAQGLSVYALRIGAVVAGLHLLGGAFLTMSAFDGAFRHGQWTQVDLYRIGDFCQLATWKGLAWSFAFGAFDALQVRLQTGGCAHPRTGFLDSALFTFHYRVGDCSTACGLPALYDPCSKVKDKEAIMFDLIVKCKPSKWGRVASILGAEMASSQPSKKISSRRVEVIHAGGNLVSPPFVDPHFHMDAAQRLAANECRGP